MRTRTCALLSAFCVFLISYQFAAAQTIEADAFYKNHGFRLPVDPQATPQAKALLKFLYEISGKAMLSGAQAYKYKPNSAPDYIKGKTGEIPAVYGMDYTYAETARQQGTDGIIKYGKMGCIPLITWHAVQPDKPESESSGWKTMHISANGYRATGNIDRILTPGSDLNKQWLVRMDRIAAHFKQIQDAGIAVMWRPLHEMNGGWFWWCNHGEQYAEMWKMMYERFTQHHDLHNIIWVYGPSCHQSYTKDYAYNYPGHEYVDALNQSVYIEYAHKFGKSQYDELLEVGNGRPIANGEVGILPDIDFLSKEQPMYNYWMTWSGFQGKGDAGGSHRAYSHPYVKNLGDFTIEPWDPKYDNPTIVPYRKTLTVKNVRFKPATGLLLHHDGGEGASAVSLFPGYGVFDMQGRYRAADGDRYQSYEERTYPTGKK
jgi:mannan endo-1,4-beta-mannosidase